jgi:SAM-dependent methyltransferase
MTQAPSVFSPSLRRLRLARAGGKFEQHDFLHRRAAEDALDRIETATRAFPEALFFGPGGPLLHSMLSNAARVERVVHAGESSAFLKAQGASDPVEAEADALPFGDKSFDLVVSLMSLHAVNDLPKALMEARRVLRPDGFFVAVFPGEKTLVSLRTALRDAEAEITGTLAPRVAPFVTLQDAASLMQRAGFALPVVDSQPVRVRYRQPLRLLHDLRGMGETSALVKGPRGGLRRDVLGRTLSALEGQEQAFELIGLTGWAPDASQPKPLKPGSGKASLADAILKGEKPRREDP